jgi:undecaprenyl-diphosphatase
MLSYLQGVILGILQGVTELFPISSLGHSTILPKMFGWEIDTHSPFFLMFLVATHSATALVLLLFFLKDWKRIVVGFFKSLKNRKIDNVDGRLAWLIIVGTVPAGLVGFVFEHFIRSYLMSATVASFFLLLNGFLLLGAETLRRRAPERDSVGSDSRISRISRWQAFKVGLMQVLALMPGFSRTGATIAGSLMVGLSHEDAVRFSFLLSTPIIGAAAALELTKLIASGNVAAMGVSVVGGISAALFAYLSVRFLLAYFKADQRKLTPFAIYCLIVGACSLIYFIHG